MTRRWVYPLDPECPDVVGFQASLDDPITVYYGVGDELSEDFDRKHRGRCRRCQEYGAANVEVDE